MIVEADRNKKECDGKEAGVVVWNTSSSLVKCLGFSAVLGLSV